METRFFTENPSLFDKLSDIPGKAPPIVEFDTLVAYFRATGYFRIRRFLENIPHIRILVGIDVDPLTARAQHHGLTIRGGAKSHYLDSLRHEIDDADYEKDTEDSVRQFIADIANGRIRIRAHPTRRLHAKIYIFRPDGFAPSFPGEVYAGSSNLTVPGLGAPGDMSNSNYEFNVALQDFDDVKFASDEFESLWEEAHEILEEDIREAMDKTCLRERRFTPFEIYIKLLIEYFGSEINFDPDAIDDMPGDYIRLNYQLDAVQQGLRILEKHNGLFLADVVGLGKTIVALMIARQFYLVNRYRYPGRILIVIPQSLKAQWEDTVRKFDFISHVKLCSIHSLHKVKHPKDYNLVIVDEAHKFRNEKTAIYENLQRICKTSGRDGEKKKVILISATPLNNRPDDIRNLVLLFQDAYNSTLGINLDKFFNQLGKEYKALIKNPGRDGIQQKLELDEDEYADRHHRIYTELREKVIEPLTVRRTRTDLLEYDLYAEDLKNQGISFPEVCAPEKLFYPLNETLNRLYDHTINCIGNEDTGLQYMQYRAVEFLVPDKRKRYKSRRSTRKTLATIMKTLMVKRLDSSFHAFLRTLERSVANSSKTINMLDDNRLDISDISRLEDFDEDDFLDVMLEEPTGEAMDGSFKKEDFESVFIDGLNSDHEILCQLLERWRAVTDGDTDPKLDKLIKVLEPELLSKDLNPVQKLVIFSESKDTTDYLAEKLASIKKLKILKVDAKNRERHQAEIQENFDAAVNPSKQKNDYNIIITTEVLAEGVNLHRANTILNYDTPWNSIRLMQRIGRVNRIGTKAEKIRIFNFFPTEQVDGDINLEHKAVVKLQAFHLTLGEDSQIYSSDEQPGTFGLFDKDHQYTEGVINERFNYLKEIRDYKNKHKREFRRIERLPLKIRNTVKNNDGRGCTIVYLRKGGRDNFYKVNEANGVDELGFLEVARIFKSGSRSKSQPLPDSHHAQVQRAMKCFKQEDSESSERNMTRNQRATTGYLKRLLDWLQDPKDYDAEVTKTWIESVRHAVRFIKTGRYQKVEKDIQVLQDRASRSDLSEDGQLRELGRIVKPYIESDTEVNINGVAANASKDTKVIIAQSYV